MSKAVVRVLIPDGGGFITVVWDLKEDDRKQPAVARDLMEKVLAKYSKRVLGLSEAATAFDAMRLGSVRQSNAERFAKQAEQAAEEARNAEAAASATRVAAEAAAKEARAAANALQLKAPSHKKQKTAFSASPSVRA